MKIDFTKFPCYKDIRKEETIEVNIKDEFANTMYIKGSGVQMASLAMKIYNSTGEEEYTPEECNMILEMSTQFAAFFADSMRDYIKNNEKDSE